MRKPGRELPLYQTNRPKAVRISEEDGAAWDAFKCRVFLHEDIFKG